MDATLIFDPDTGIRVPADTAKLSGRWKIVRDGEAVSILAENATARSS